MTFGVINIDKKVRWLGLKVNGEYQINFYNFYMTTCIRQESWAIAKMTARCALYMGALKIFESAW